MRVTFYHRKVLPGAFSVEGYFRDVRNYLPADVEWKVATSRFMSSGVLRRVYNILEAPSRHGDINHITGDVHFLTYLLEKSRTILTILDCGILHQKTGLERELLRWLWYAIPARRVAAITVISQATKDDLLRFVRCDPDLIRVVYVSISAEFQPKRKEFEQDKPRVLQVGTTPNKNIERTAEALSGLRCHLDIVGRLSASQRDALERSGIEYTTSYHLTEAEIRAKYENSDIVMFASTVEGFGMPIVEANTVGRPVITSNVSSMPEVAGEAACLVDPFQPESIRSGFLRVVRDADYRRSLVELGFENRKRFSASAIAQQYYALYREVLARIPS
jgi:glycosyltransferase involved in cell wall biosynthesis